MLQDAIAIFFNTLGGAISVSIAQNIFSNTLIKQVPIKAPGINPADLLDMGATHVQSDVPHAVLRGVLEAYATAVTQCFILSIATGGLAFICSLFLEWKSVKGKKLMSGGGA